MGFYISGHPLNHYLSEIKQFTNKSTKSLAQCLDGEEIRVIGIISYIKLTNTKKSNERMAIIRVEDMDGEVEVVIFPSTYNELAGYLNEGKVVFVTGRVSLRDQEPKIVANSMKNIDQMYDSVTALNVDLSSVSENKLEELKKKLANFPGSVPVYLNLDTQTKKGVQILVGKDLYVSPSEDLMNEIKSIVGQESLNLTIK